MVWVFTYKRRLFGYNEAVRSLWEGNHREILLFAGDRERKQREQSFGRESKQASSAALLCFASGMDVLRCALCGEPAALHCERDDAFLCWPCDTSVHSHNSIVVRHTRSVLCSTCNAPTRFRTSGGSPSPFACLCTECSPAVCDGAAAANNVCRHINNNINDVSDRMSSTFCGAAAAADAEQGRRRHGAAASPPRPAIRILKTKELHQQLQQQQASCAEELGNDGLLCPQEVRRRRRRIVRHASGRYRKAPRHSSRRCLKDPRFTIQ